MRSTIFLLGFAQFLFDKLDGANVYLDSECPKHSFSNSKTSYLKLFTNKGEAVLKSNKNCVSNDQMIAFNGHSECTIPLRWDIDKFSIGDDYIPTSFVRISVNHMEIVVWDGNTAKSNHIRYEGRCAPSMRDDKTLYVALYETSSSCNIEFNICNVEESDEYAFRRSGLSATNAMLMDLFGYSYNKWLAVLSLLVFLLLLAIFYCLAYVCCYVRRRRRRRREAELRRRHEETTAEVTTAATSATSALGSGKATPPKVPYLKRLVTLRL